MGIEHRPDGVVCKWTLLRGVSADKTVEWENKYWEAADEFGYKELASEKSGRDAAGNVWREYWRESMLQVRHYLNMNLNIKSRRYVNDQVSCQKRTISFLFLQ